MIREFIFSSALAGAAIAGVQSGTKAVAADSRDDAIFGDGGVADKIEEKGQARSDSASARAGVSPSSSRLIDSMQIGGRLEVRSSFAQEEQQAFAKSQSTQLKRADIYFDSRPNEDLRSLLRLRLSETSPQPTQTSAADNSSCTNCTKTEIDELWFKWDLANTAYFTAGKQHLKWGSGRFWNPTDFTAVTSRDPLAQFDSRLGQELIKVHIPVEKQGFNYYALLQFDDVHRNDDIGGSLRGEFAFAGRAEMAISFSAAKNKPLRGGLDISGGLGPVDLYSELAVSKGQKKDFYEGELNPAAGQLPKPIVRDDDMFTEVVAGVQYTFKYSADDNLTLGVEAFENGLGYSDRELEMYSLILGQSKPLYAGRRYAGAYARLPSPGSWNDTSFFLYGMKNLSDGTSLARITTTWSVFNDATIEAFASQCFGDYGELCFRAPEEYAKLSASPFLSPDLKARLAGLPVKRLKVNGGLAMSLSF